MNEKTKKTLNGWARLIITDYDANGEIFYIVCVGNDAMPAHTKTIYNSYDVALEAFNKLI